MGSSLKRSDIFLNGNDKYEHRFDLPSSDL